MTQRMKELISIIGEADLAYYKYDNPIMSDLDYDRHYDELLLLERQTGIVLSGSPTQKVPGEILESLAQVRHTRPMLSADKTKSIAELMRFIDGKAVVISWKLDGLTLVLRYEDGRLTQAVTRGTDGLIGEDVTHTVRNFMNVPLEIPCKEAFEVRGEGVISWSSFERINAETEGELYTHPRSLAAGAVRRLDPKKSRNQFLEFYAFELTGDGYTKKTDKLKALADNGFDVVRYQAISSGSSQEQIESAVNSFKPEEFGYPADGLVIEYNDVAYGESLGATGHYENRLIALKWADELYETVFLGLELAPTRTGMISLTGKFADVLIDGTTVNRAFLHNIDIMDSFSLGIGDRVKIYKANKIIPQLAENITKSGTLAYPTACPCCGSMLTIRKSEGGTRLFYCEDPSCPAKLVQKFMHFCSKTRMNVPGVSKKTLMKFINNGWIKNFGDLYELDKWRTEFVSTPGFGLNLFNRIQKAVDNRRNCTLRQLIASLSIPMVGRSAGGALDAYFNGSWEDFEAAIQAGFDFTCLKDFGQTMNDNIYAWYADENEAKLWRPLMKHINLKKEKERQNMDSINNPFHGKTVAATGKLNNYSRSSIQTKLLELGAKPCDSVNKSTDYLIVGEKAGSKLAKAQKLGVTTLTEAEFEAMLKAG